MSRHRRAVVMGGGYFFTVVTYQHRAICDAFMRLVSVAIEEVRASRPFIIDA